MWSYEFKSGAWTPLCDRETTYLRAVWSPDGKSLAISRAEGDAEFVNVYRISLAAPQKAERLTEQPNFGQFPQDWSSTANGILLVEGTHPTTLSDILFLPLTGAQQPRKRCNLGRRSQPGIFARRTVVCYASGPKEDPRLMIQALDAGAHPRQVSSDRGSDPSWSRDGKRLYFLGSEMRLMEAAIDSAGRPVRVRQISGPNIAAPKDWWTRAYSLAPDGRFLVIRDIPNERPPSSEIHVVLNWFQELAQLAPTP